MAQWRVITSKKKKKGKKKESSLLMTEGDGSGLFLEARVW